MKKSIFGTILLLWIQYCQASIGNQSPFFGKCVYKCLEKNCLNYGAEFRMKYPRPIYLELLRWSCGEECEYNCMWKTVRGFQDRNYDVPQFYGKWPFIRFLGIQEPASTLFSLFNLYVHIKMLKRVKNDLRPDTPLRWLYFVYGFINCHAWIWSAIFHARDVEFTEFMDYSCAFSIILVSCYSMIIRVFKGFTKLNFVATFFFLTFLISHTLYLQGGSFDYGYNMRVNISTGLFTIICWLLWSLWNRKRLPHVWKISLYVILVALATLLEVIDLPPLWWCFDCHAIWHLSTVPLHILYYSFVLDDCRYLRNEELKYEKLAGLQ